MAVTPGRIAVPSDWEVRTQITYIEPPDSSLKVPLAVQQTAAKPRANVVVSRSASSAASAEAAMNDFLSQTAQAVPGLRRLSQGDIDFADGATGVWLTVAFNATPQVRLAQRHVFRMDAGVLTQLVATAEEQRVDDLDGRMTEIIRSFSP